MGAALSRMHHCDYVAEIVYEESTGLFQGRVINVEGESLDFLGNSVDEFRAEFARSVGIYEEGCRDAGREPERPRPVATERGRARLTPSPVPRR
jgi:predicted HicB family RNase H-like nuclease